MFDRLSQKPGDPILQLMLAARQDTNTKTVDLTAGIYKDEYGQTPVMAVVKEAEQRRINSEATKAYLGIAGNEEFNCLMARLALGDTHPALLDDRVRTIQTTGGSGAIRLAVELLYEINPTQCVWVSDPTWGNHIPLLGARQLVVKTYPYYKVGEAQPRFAEMMQVLSEAAAGDVVLLQGCCHNPSGADLTFEQWQQLTDLFVQRGLIPFIDSAYHGLARGVEDDAAGWRHLLAQVPEALLSYSASKNFSIYRDRGGVLLSISQNTLAAGVTMSNMLALSRVLYSVPPAHAAALIADILSDTNLTDQWLSELATMRARMNDIRARFASELAMASDSADYRYIAQQTGMFSFLNLSPQQIATLQRDWSVYLLGSGRINVAGLTPNNLKYVAQAIVGVTD